MQSWNILPVLSALTVYNSAAQFIAPGQCPPSTCTKFCPTGYVLDSNGCRTCACSSSLGSAIANPGGDPFHQGGNVMGPPGAVTGPQVNTSPTYTNPCIRNAPCGITRCDSGFYNGPGGCQFCVCAPDRSALNTYTNPCSDAAPTCDAVCNNGFHTGTDGCQYCQCASIEHVTEMTTVPSTTPPMSKEDKCLMKITHCQLQHPYGFMTDSACEMCVGKDEIYKLSEIPEERQPMVKLGNPCIMGFDVCRIFCASGYKAGPRSCQYCACKNDDIWTP